MLVTFEVSQPERSSDSRAGQSENMPYMPVTSDTSHVPIPTISRNEAIPQNISLLSAGSFKRYATMRSKESQPENRETSRLLSQEWLTFEKSKPEMSRNLRDEQPLNMLAPKYV